MKSKEPDISWTITNKNKQCTHIGFTEHVFDAIHYWMSMEVCVLLTYYSVISA